MGRAARKKFSSHWAKEERFHLRAHRLQQDDISVTGYTGSRKLMKTLYRGIARNIYEMYYLDSIVPKLIFFRKK